jgi:molecular chaperone DnaK
LIPGAFRPIIRRNTTIPTTRAELFHTITPNQDTVEIEVYQGDSPVAKENTHLTSFKLTEIPPAPNPDDLREVIVEFSYNINGIVEVTARNHGGERREMATVNATAGKRAASERETKAHFDPTLERDVKRSLDAAVTLELQLEADGKTKEAKRLRDARHALEEAHEGENEKRVMDKLNELDDALYDLEQ